MRHRHLAALALLALIVVSAACRNDAGGDTTQTTPSRTETNTSDQANVTETDTSVVITITGLAFPAEVTVPAGKRVTWVNDSSAPHEVQMDTRDGAPAEVEPVRLGTDQEGELSLEPGTWAYFCSIHPSMTGTLVVQG